MRRKLTDIGVPLIALAAIFGCLLSGCIVNPRPLAGPRCASPCGPGGCVVSPCPPRSPLHHPLMHCPQLKGNPYVVYPPSGGTVSITPGGAPPVSE